MKTEHFDFIVIGGGSAGYAAARTAREHMERVAIVDGSPELGGLCILRGCMPSKTVIYSAEILHQAQRANLFGLNIPSASADMKAMLERKIRMVDDFKAYRQEQLESDRFTLFRDQARFISTDTIELKASRRHLTADHFLIATGSVPNAPLSDLKNVDYRTSDDVLDLDFIPPSAIVLGGGIIACELGQYLHRIGSRVTFIQRSPRILKEASPEASTVIEQAFRDEGIHIHTDTRITAIQQFSDNEFRVKFESPEGEKSVDGAYLFNALGRKPAVDGLGLEAAGVKHGTSGYISIDSNQRTSNPRIFAAGDVCGPHEIVHLAIMQGEIAAQTAAGLSPSPLDYHHRTSITFTDPQIASAGMSEHEAADAGFDTLTASYPFDDHGKSILMEAKYGYVKVIAERTSGRVVGAECVGRDAGELIHAMAVAVSLESTVDQLVKVHWYHPTLSEIWSYPLEEIQEQLSSN